MKKLLPFSFLILCLITTAGFAQSKKYFAVTGEQYGSVNWIAFRQFDLDGKTPVRTLYVPALSGETVYDAVSGKQLLNDDAKATTTATTPQSCGCLNNRMVAAIAYDAKSNRIYYTQMTGNQLH